MTGIPFHSTSLRYVSLNETTLRCDSLHYTLSTLPFALCSLPYCAFVVKINNKYLANIF